MTPPQIWSELAHKRQQVSRQILNVFYDFGIVRIEDQLYRGIGEQVLITEHEGEIRATDLMNGEADAVQRLAIVFRQDDKRRALSCREELHERQWIILRIQWNFFRFTLPQCWHSRSYHAPTGILSYEFWYSFPVAMTPQ